MKKFLAIFAIMFIALLNTPVTVHASTTGANDAVVDIMNNSRYEGAIDSIKGITEIVDVGFTAFITFIAFFIISAAMLRNVLAGAYCAYPKFWDKVDAAHAEVADTGWVTRIKGLGSSYQNVNMGSLGKAVMRLLPNIKKLTDFEDNLIEPKSYFIKAIPQMIGVIIIGVFIYNGYYRDTAATVSNFGSVMFKRVILSADPVAVFDRITGATGRPEFETDNALTDNDQLVNDIAKSAYSKIISTYSDVSGASEKSSLASQLEKHISSAIAAKCPTYAENADEWKPSYDVSLTIGATTMKDSHTTDGLGYSFVLNDLPISDLGLNTNKEIGSDWHLTVVVNFKKQVAKSTTVTVTDITMTVTGMIKNKITLTLPTGTSSKLVVYNTTTIGGKKVDFNANTGELTFTDGMPSGTSWTCVGLGYKGTNGKTHKIVKITFTSSSSQTASGKLTSATYELGDLTYGSDVADNLEKKK